MLDLKTAMQKAVDAYVAPGNDKMKELLMTNHDYLMEEAKYRAILDVCETRYAELPLPIAATLTIAEMEGFTISHANHEVSDTLDWFLNKANLTIDGKVEFTVTEDDVLVVYKNPGDKDRFVNPSSYMETIARVNGALGNVPDDYAFEVKVLLEQMALSMLDIVPAGPLRTTYVDYEGLCEFFPKYYKEENIPHTPQDQMAYRFFNVLNPPSLIEALYGPK